MRICAFILAVSFGCGSANTPAEEPVQEPPVEVAVEVAQPTSVSRIPRCAAPVTPKLTSYLEVRAGDGVVRHLDVGRSENGVWMPAENIRMPMHHATAIRWTNIAELSLLPQSTDERMRFSFTLLTRDIRQVAERQWRTEYTAEVSAVCAVTDDTSRAAGEHVPDIHTDSDQCVQSEDDVEASVRAAAQCSSNADCVIREISACELRGLGCYWVAVHRDADSAPIEAAIRAHENSDCTTSECDCPTPPETAECVEGSCRSL